MMTDQFECAFVTGFRDNLSYLCMESPIFVFYWKYAPFFHILNDDMYMRCFWIFNKKKRCVLLYLLNVQVASTVNKENKTSLWWRISLNVLSWQDSETICHIYAIHYYWKRRFWCYLHILNDDMYMMLSVRCFWIFNKKKRCVKSWISFF
jgi:hypothetical protein